MITGMCISPHAIPVGPILAAGYVSVHFASHYPAKMGRTGIAWWLMHIPVMMHYPVMHGKFLANAPILNTLELSKLGPLT